MQSNKNSADWSPRIHRRGLSVTELVVGLVVLTVMMSMASVVIANMAQQRLWSGREFLAQQSLANVLEQVSAMPFHELTDDGLASIVLDEQVGVQIPNATLTLEVAETVDDTSFVSRRVTARIRWRNGEAQRPVQLEVVVWRHGNSTGDPRDAT